MLIGRSIDEIEIWDSIRFIGTPMRKFRDYRSRWLQFCVKFRKGADEGFGPCNGKKCPVEKKTRPDTLLPQSRLGGQGPFLRSLDHLGKSSGVKEIKS